jgi:topoisomerase IA-like protein
LATIHDLHTSISDMSDSDAQSLISRRRSSRRIQKAANKKATKKAAAKKKKVVDVSNALGMLSPQQKAALAKELLG